MLLVREPILRPVAILDLRPTQITIGMREVREKRMELRRRGDKEIARFLGTHMIPVILGPAKRCYIIDHHHLSLALHGEGLKQVLVLVVSDLSTLDRGAFWTFLDNSGWTHPYDENGVRRDYAEIPKTVDKMKDDPYRSLAGELRRAGGFAKDTTPFSEFLWADFLRRHIKRKKVRGDFDRAFKAALKLAHSRDAHYLPGWCGPLD